MKDMASLKVNPCDAVHGTKLVTIEQGPGVLHGSLLSWFLARLIADDVTDLGVAEQRRVEVDRLLGLPAPVPTNMSVGTIRCVIFVLPRKYQRLP